MSKILSDCPDSAHCDVWAGDVLLRQERDDEDDEEEDEGNGKKEPDAEDAHDGAEDDGYSE